MPNGNGPCVVLVSGYRNIIQAAQGVEAVRSGIKIVPESPIRTMVESDLTDRVSWICRLRDEAAMFVGKNFLRKVFYKCKERQIDTTLSSTLPCSKAGQMIVVSGLPDRHFALVVAAELDPIFPHRLTIALEDDLECARIIEGLPSETLKILIEMLQTEAARRHHRNGNHHNESDVLAFHRMMLEEEVTLE